MAETGLYNLTFANASLDAGQVEDAQDGYFVPVKVLRETYEAACLIQEPIRKPRHLTSSLSDSILQVTLFINVYFEVRWQQQAS